MLEKLVEFPTVSAREIRRGRLLLSDDAVIFPLMTVGVADPLVLLGKSHWSQLVPGKWVLGAVNESRSFGRQSTPPSG